MKTVISLILCAILQFSWVSGTAAVAADPPSDTIRAVRIADVINPVVADFIVGELKQANASSQRAFLLELDTPGGLDTSMRAIIRAILGSKIPVIVYVYPAGARAASAGALITLSADFAAMAPGTNIGAAHPVSVGFGGAEKGSTMMEKVVNDAVAYARSIAEQRGRNVGWAEDIVRKSISTPAREALKLKVIDAIADNPADLLQKLDDRSYLRGGQKIVFHSGGARLELVEMGARQRILTVLSNPTIAYLLLMLGILGIFFEISQPGVILPGTLGAIALLLAFFAFQTLPVNYVGVLLILLAFILFILEVKIVSYGMLTVGGIVSMALGSIMLFESPDPYLRLSWTVIAATVGVCSGFFALALYFMVRTHRTPFVSGLEGMIGERGRAVSDVHSGGRVFVHGEYWDASSHEPIAAGESVEVVRVEKGILRLEVRRVGQPQSQKISKEDT